MRKRYADLVSVGPDAPAGRYLRRFWQPVYVSDELLPRRPVPLRVMDEDFTLYRGDSGRAAVLGPRCPHRGLLLSVGRVQGDCLSCLYHGWTFDPEGQCVDQPAEKRSFAQTTKVASYPTREYHGVIFAYFGGGAPPEFPHLDLLDGDGTVDVRVEKRPFPFFNQLENTVDEVHFNFVHRVSKFADAGLNSHIPEVTCEETDYGIARYGKRGNVVRLSHVIMPNCSLTSVPRGEKLWADHVAWRVPINRHSHLSFSIDLIHKLSDDAPDLKDVQAAEAQEILQLEPLDSLVDKILRSEIHIDDVGNRPDLVFLQDTVAMKGQGAVDREVDLLGASDRQVKLLREVWTRELNSLEAGETLKSWRLPSGLQATRGV